MKRVLIQLSISCALSLFVSQAFAAERVLASGQKRDCSHKTDAKQKARCEDANRAMEACAGKKAGDELTSCLMAQRMEQRKNK